MHFCKVIALIIRYFSFFDLITFVSNDYFIDIFMSIPKFIKNVLLNFLHPKFEALERFPIGYIVDKHDTVSSFVIS